MEQEMLMASLAAIIAAGIGASWLGWWLRVPSILVLLAVGIIAGPITGLLDPDLVFGELLLPFVSLSVGIILFEGGLTLSTEDLKQIARPLLGLLTVGILVTWVVSTLAAYFVLKLPFTPALLLGAILVVTGPTVIGPLLQHIRPMGSVAAIARWEGILIDPIGAIAAVLVFEATTAVESTSPLVALQHATMGLAATIAIGTLIGVLSAAVLGYCLRRHWIPDHLESAAVLAAAVAAFVGSNALQHESGLVTVTLMGIVLSNQKQFSIKHIMHFKETLTVLLICTLFVVLTARLRWEHVTSLGWRGGLFVLLVILVARPLSVFAATVRSTLCVREKLFLSWLAPRGIVAAAVASVFALELHEHGQAEAGDALVTATFLVILGTVTTYGLTSGLVARWLGLSVQNPQGVLFAGAHPVALELAEALQRADFVVRLVDTNRENVNRANMRGVPALYANVLSETTTESLDLAGLGRFLAITPNDEVNSLACRHFSEIFGRPHVYRLKATNTSRRKQASAEASFGRPFLRSGVTLEDLEEKLEHGWRVTSTRLTEQFTFEDFLRRHGAKAILAFTIGINETLTVCGDRPDPTVPRIGELLIAIVPGKAVANPASSESSDDTESSSESESSESESGSEDQSTEAAG